MKANNVLLGVAALVALVGWGVRQSEPLRTRVLIDAPPEQVWQVLTDTAQYGQWNPVMVRMTGRLQAGQTIEFENHSQDGNTMTFRPTVLRADAGRELRWLGRLWVPRLFDGEHYFVLTPTTGGKTQLEHGETFRGALVPFVRGWLRGTVQNDFHRINAALKARAEAGN
ncbi:SRPBCC domain-containing protein [Deinococcus piscis]|nr:SRPBCC domain-containing protein [Deinococcus piscis]